MRTLLLGTDFMYNNNGDLVPIEINTNIGGTEAMIEDQNLVYDISGIGQLIQNNSINKVYYIGSHYQFEQKLQLLNYLKNLGEEVQLSKGTKNQLEGSLQYIWGNFFYVKDPKILTFISLIHPQFIRKIHKLVLVDK